MSKVNISFGINDILFILTVNNGSYKENTTTLTGKIIIINENLDINLYNLSKLLSNINIQHLNIISIHNSKIDNEKFEIDSLSKVIYIEANINTFLNILNNTNPNSNSGFLQYNKDTLYVLRNGSYIDIKRLITKIDGYDVDIGRGGGQKSHMLSPLDFRLSCYLMAMYNFDYHLISSLNTFNFISKDRYLPFICRKLISKTYTK